MYLTDEQRKRLAQRARDVGTSEAAVIRQILDAALGIDDGTDELLAAIDATFGICRDYPGWEEWLANVRGTEGGADARLKRMGR
jgi:plasmid stability protein